MNTNLQKGQKAQTPDGAGLVESILGEEITVKLNDGNTATYPADVVTDDADPG